MKIERLELRLLKLPLVHFFETSFGRIDDKHFILVRLDGAGASGFGECVAEQDPYYSSETNDTVWHIIESFVAPRVLDVEFAHPRDVFPALKAIRGHNMAKAAVEMAAWDLYARQADVPLARVLGGTRDRIASGVSIGIQDTLAGLASKVEREIAAGYRRIKIKIKPGWDLEAVATVRARFGAVPLMVDANAAYTRDDADHLAKLDRYDLMMIEQPLDYDDVMDHAVLQTRIKTPICLDESILTVADARHALELGSCKIVNIKLRRVGGHTEARAIQEYCRNREVPVWCGGMLESGVGRAHNIAMSTLAGFTLPGDVSASARYWEEDIIEPPVTVSPQGTIQAPAGPGIGYEVNERRIESLMRRREEMAL